MWLNKRSKFVEKKARSQDHVQIHSFWKILTCFHWTVSGEQNIVLTYGSAISKFFTAKLSVQTWSRVRTLFLEKFRNRFQGSSQRGKCTAVQDLACANYPLFLRILGMCCLMCASWLARTTLLRCKDGCTFCRKKQKANMTAYLLVWNVYLSAIISKVHTIVRSHLFITLCFNRSNIFMLVSTNCR